LSIERTVNNNNNTINNINNCNNCNNETVTPSTEDIKWRLAMFLSTSPYSYNNLVVYL